MRIGHGYDVHRFAEDRALILGGERIDYRVGLLGHSDADVLLHAVMDALLGAAGLRDIGFHFPDTDMRYKDADSRMLLRAVREKLEIAGYRVSNVDVTVIAQAPKLKPYIPKMMENIAGDLGIDVSRVNVKATTEEGLGFTGDGSGMAAHAVGAVFAVDTTSSYAMIPIDVERDHVDFCMASAQKGLMAMTGLSFIVGREDIVGTMVDNNRTAMRYTGLCRRLSEQGGN